MTATNIFYNFVGFRYSPPFLTCIIRVTPFISSLLPKIKDGGGGGGAMFSAYSSNLGGNKAY